MSQESTKPHMPYDEEKLQELMLYIMNKHGPEGIDIEKLQWLCFLCDMEAYRQTGKSITGAVYVKEGEQLDNKGDES